MADVLALGVVVTMSVAHPYSVGCYTVRVCNLNLAKDHNFSDYDVLM